MIPTSIILFVGEKRSPTAIKMGVRWEDGRLAAKQLFDALNACGIARERCSFVNRFERGGVSVIRKHRGPVVAMGLKVQNALARDKVSFVPLIHPAARGAIRRKDLYAAHVQERMTLVRQIEEL